MRASIVALFTLGLLAACSKPNPYYCEGHPDNNCLLDGGRDMQACTTSDDCTNPSQPVCEPTQKKCVACTPEISGACADTTPVCTAANTCTACVAHSNCASQACLPTGACGDDTTVAYVSATGDDTSACTRGAPCRGITMAAMKGKPYIKVQTDLDEAVTLNNVSLTILANPGVAVRRSTIGAVVDIRGTSNVTIRDLIVRDGLGTTGHGIVVPFGEPVNLKLDRVNLLNNAGVGLSMQGGSIEMSRSVVSGNTYGGAYVNGMFNITNSLFVANGNGLSTTGGVFLTPAGTVTFKFNTVANNTATSGAIRGINCTLAMPTENTIVSGNDVSGSCNLTYSLFDTGTNVSGSNRAGDPSFKNTVAANPLAVDYFRIQPTSAAVDGGDPASLMMTDIDGDARPNGSAPDIGADELK